MRKINKNYLQPPAALTGPMANTRLLTIAAAKRYNENTYKDPTVIRALKFLYHEKCGYCEASITTVSHQHVEHYRPKGSVSPTDLAGIAHVGYYWLGNEWSNLLIACTWCNENGRKGIRFPLTIPANRVTDHPALISPALYDIDANNISHFHLAGEDPLIINPEVTDPLQHLTVWKTGKLKEKRNSQKGKTTISICDLNRGALIEKRKGIIDDIVDSINDLLDEYYAPIEPLSENQFQRRFFVLLDKITMNTVEKAQYTLVYHEVINKFNTLIISHKHIDPAFRPLVKKHFDEY